MSTPKTIYRSTNPDTGEVIFAEKGGRAIKWLTFIDFNDGRGLIHAGYSSQAEYKKAAVAARSTNPYGARYDAAPATVVTAAERDAEQAAAARAAFEAEAKTYTDAHATSALENADATAAEGDVEYESAAYWDVARRSLPYSREAATDVEALDLADRGQHLTYQGADWWIEDTHADTLDLVGVNGERRTVARAELAPAEHSAPAAAVEASPVTVPGMLPVMECCGQTYGSRYAYREHTARKHGPTAEELEQAYAHNAQVAAVDAWIASRLEADQERRESGRLSLEDTLEYADQMRQDTTCVGLPNWPAPTRRVIEGVIVEHAGTATGSLPRHAGHPLVTAARDALDGLAAATLTDHHDVTEPTEAEQDVRGYMIDPREGNRVAVYWLEGGRIVRHDDRWSGASLDILAHRLTERGWTVEKMLRSSQCVFAWRTDGDTTTPARPAPLVRCGHCGADVQPAPDGLPMYHADRNTGQGDCLGSRQPAAPALFSPEAAEAMLVGIPADAEGTWRADWISSTPAPTDGRLFDLGAPTDQGALFV